ncbi:hypothetical protein ACHAW5_008863 [Stephanodiscus triporus]|uniref:Coenzyme Q-binding protein COQ10 START domain-containing protein n=1 Tax=Stephanodiscus triporus TaxID=2934178 RepID=A0ABD3QRE2_9STRA
MALGRNAGDAKDEFHDHHDDDDDATSRTLIECSADILLPFSEDLAFEYFSDLTRQPSWCKYLHSVEYVGVVDGTDGDTTLRESRWTVGVRGLRFSWTARDTIVIRPSRIEWESTSGMKNTGSVVFASLGGGPSSSTSTTRMTLTFKFVAPRAVSGLFRRSGRLRKYTEEFLLGNMLTDFRDVVLAEMEGGGDLIT